MSPGASGLERDLHLVRRRAWVFLPFLLFGIFVALALGRVSGDANAVASLQIESVIHDAVIGGDRGLRIFEADAMSADEPFKAKVRERIGDPNFDYGRFSISLLPHSVADGVSRGVLTVAVVDASKPEAERLRQAWVDTFKEEYTRPDGLFRMRFIEKKKEVVANAEAEYRRLYDALKPQADAKGIPLDALQGADPVANLPAELFRVEADLQRSLAEVEGAIAAGATGAAASVVLGGQPVGDAEVARALQARRATLQGAITLLRKQRASISDGAFDPAFQTQLDELRGAAQIKNQTQVRLANAFVAIRSTESHVDVSYTGSGGFTGTSSGRVAIILAITVVFGLIAIYTLEWLSQLRRNIQ